jgi:hypothetical protein
MVAAPLISYSTSWPMTKSYIVMQLYIMAESYVIISMCYDRTIRHYIAICYDKTVHHNIWQIIRHILTVIGLMTFCSTYFSLPFPRFSI